MYVMYTSYTCAEYHGTHLDSNSQLSWKVYFMCTRSLCPLHECFLGDVGEEVPSLTPPTATRFNGVTALLTAGPAWSKQLINRAGAFTSSVHSSIRRLNFCSCNDYNGTRTEHVLHGFCESRLSSAAQNDAPLKNASFGAYSLIRILQSTVLLQVGPAVIRIVGWPTTQREGDPKCWWTGRWPIENGHAAVQPSKSWDPESCCDP